MNRLALEGGATMDAYGKYVIIVHVNIKQHRNNGIVKMLMHKEY